MAKVLEITEEHIKGKPPRDVVEKVVEITEDCPLAIKDGERCVLLFMRVGGRERVVQVCRPYPGKELMGTFIYFGVDDLESWANMKPPNAVFGVWAGELGFTAEGFRALIERHAPPAAA